MGWNNRIFRRELGTETLYSVREAYYDDEGNLDGYTSEPIFGEFDDLGDLISTFGQIQKDINKFSDNVIQIED